MVISIILTSTLTLLRIKKNTFLLIIFQDFFQGKSPYLGSGVQSGISFIHSPQNLLQTSLGEKYGNPPQSAGSCTMVLITHGKLWPENIKWKMLEISNSKVLNSYHSEWPDVISCHPAPSCLGGQSPLYSGYPTVSHLVVFSVGLPRGR